MSTPGVYIEEIPTFPPSVAPVETAIPAFVGITQKTMDENGDTLINVPKRITSLLEYENLFGKAAPQPFTVNIFQEATWIPFQLKDPIIELDGTAPTVPNKGDILFYAIQMFYANGGGPCYIVSAQDNQFIDAINVLEEYDEPTLIASPEAVGQTNYAAIVDSSLQQCNKLQDRFAVIDVLNAQPDGVDTISEVDTNFRSKIISDLSMVKYGAAYYPFLNTSLPFLTNDLSITVKTHEVTVIQAKVVKDIVDRLVVAANALAPANATFKNSATAAQTQANTAKGEIDEVYTSATKVLAKTKINDAQKELTDATKLKAKVDDAKTKADDVPATTTGSDVVKKLASQLVEETNKLIDEINKLKIDIDNELIEFPVTISKIPANSTLNTVDQAKFSRPYNAIKALIAKYYVRLPPSSSVAGAYARVDNDRGVWKAPANVSLLNVIAPAIKVTNDFQDHLNVDPTSGKSVNAIRTFTGRGTLVWGARTLAGNDNEWRYVPVRRFFNFAEESIKKATGRFVFEPNDKNTWTMVKTMIENFLLVQWRSGALAGEKPEHAFYVKVGLNQTMTADDINNGFMIVEIGMAVVRPAEFIILKFSHKMQES